MKNKRYIILLVIFIALFLLLYFLVGKDSIEESKHKLTILTGDDTVWQYSNSTWSNIDISKNSNDINWKKYKIYLDGKYKNNYYIWHDDKWYIFDENKKAVNYYTENIFAYNSNFEIKINEFNSVENKEIDSYISKFLGEKGVLVTQSSQLTVNTKTVLDIDSDGKNEVIYIVSNVFPLEFNPTTVFSYIFMVKDNKTYEIYSYKEENKYTNGVKPYITSIIDTNNDGIYEIVFTFARYSTLKPINSMYEFRDNKFKLLISNE